MSGVTNRSAISRRSVKKKKTAASRIATKRKRPVTHKKPVITVRKSKKLVSHGGMAPLSLSDYMSLL